MLGKDEFSLEKYKIVKELLDKRGVYVSNESCSLEKNDDEVIPASYSQKRFWFLYESNPNSFSYNINISLVLYGNVDVDALKSSFDILVDKHQALRTTFFVDDGELYQKINKKIDNYFFSNNALKCEKYSDYETYSNIAVHEAKRIFDLYTGSLFNVSIYRFSDKEYLLCMTLHHIIADGWSLGILSSDITEIYNSVINGEIFTFTSEIYQFADYSIAETSRFKMGGYDKCIDYWLGYLSDATFTLSLPYDSMRSNIIGFDGSVVEFELDSNLVSMLKKLSVENNASLFMILYVAYSILIFRETLQCDFTIGIPVACRSDLRFNKTVGPFINTNVYRSIISSGDSFLQLLNKQRKQMLNHLQYQDAPLEKLVELINPDRSAGYNPLFQTMLTYQSSDLPNLIIDNVTSSVLNIDINYSQCDLSMTFWHEGDIIRGTLEYCSDCFERNTIIRMKREYMLILESILQNPNENVCTIDLLCDEMKFMLICEWNSIITSCYKVNGILSMIKQQMQKHPNAPAVITKTNTLSYCELELYSNAVLYELIKSNVLFGEPIIIFSGSLHLMVCAILAVIKLGGVYIPIDSDTPKERIKFIINDCSVKTIITDELSFTKLPDTCVKIIVLDRIEYIERNIDYKCPEINERCPICIIYTSGSTGTPKGVIITHGNLLNMIESFIASYVPITTDVMLPITSIGYSSFIGELFPILCSGGCIILCKKNVFADINELAELINKYKVTICSTVPSVLRHLNQISCACSSLRLIISGGEKLYYNDVDMLYSMGLQIVNSYGSTEGGICASFHTVDKDDAISNNPIPIGKPTVNNRIYIMDEFHNLLGIGCKGYIYVSGDGVSRGYVNNPTLTNALFTKDPFVDSELSMYSTGDIGYLDVNGNLHYVGRNDEQFKIRGFRVEKSEITKALLDLPQISDCVVVVEHDKNRSVNIVAYVVCVDISITSKSIFKSLRKSIPDYMIPTEIYFISEIPYLLNGKIDYQSLKRHNIEKVHTVNKECDSLDDYNEIQRGIIEIWKMILDRNHIDIDDNFFDIGGHSLKVIEAQRFINKVFDTNISIVDLFQYPTVRLLSDYITGSSNNEFIESMIKRANKMRASTSIE